MMKKSKKNIVDELSKREFRVAMFGSARIQPGDMCYDMSYNLAKMCGKEGFDVITGGGPGIMEAANKGLKDGVKKSKSNGHSIGLTIRLPQEQAANKHLDIKQHFDRFSDRLDHFMILSSVVVVMPGGVGTCLEFFYTWQLSQVKHICSAPIILVGSMWEELVKWITDYPLKEKYISPNDFNNVITVKDDKEAFEVIMKANEIFKKEGKDYCFNFKKYKLR